MKQTWNASQIVQSNGAYAGKTVTFMDPLAPATAVTGILRRASSSDENPGNVLLLVAFGPDLWRDSGWYSVPSHALVEVS